MGHSPPTVGAYRSFNACLVAGTSGGFSMESVMPCIDIEKRRKSAREWARKARRNPEYRDKINARRREPENRAKGREAERKRLSDPVKRRNRQDYINKWKRDKYASDETWRADRIKKERARQPVQNAHRRQRYASDPEYRYHVREYNRSRISRTRRHLETLITMQGGVCPLCGFPLPSHRSEIHVDHLVSKHDGGSDSIENLAAVHAVCNLKKGARSIEVTIRKD